MAGRRRALLVHSPNVEEEAQRCAYRKRRLRGQWELFDLEKDPEELHNVYGMLAYTDVAGRLKQKLVEKKAEYDVPEDP